LRPRPPRLDALRRNHLVTRRATSPAANISQLRERRSFAKIPEILEVPDLIDIQKGSFDWLLESGLRETFDDISPIEDFTGNLIVEFGDYEFGDPKYSVDECKEKDMS
jgi:DNA-directed RNA polymerase subunit beta